MNQIINQTPLISKRFSKGIDDPLFSDTMCVLNDVYLQVKEFHEITENDECDAIRLISHGAEGGMFIEFTTPKHLHTLITLDKRLVHRIVCIAFPELHQQLININK